MPPGKIIRYTDLLHDIYSDDKEIDNRQVIELLRCAESIPVQMFTFKGLIHLIDYSQRKFLALSGKIKNIFGYDPKEILDAGLEFSIDIFQKDDFKIYNEEIFPLVIDFLQRTPQEEHGDYLFTYSYRMRKSDGKWMQLYQQGRYVTDPKTNLPLFSVALVADISSLKKDTSMIFSIDKKRNGGSNQIYQNIVTNYYHPQPENARLSRREREILGRLADGLSSKQIAEKLHLSELTVVTHRKNLLKKTNSKNVAELIRYAISNGII